HAAKLKGACVEDIDYRTARGLDKSVIRALAQKSAWVASHENIFVLGPTGVGKSFLACALAQKACRDGYSALYTRAGALFRDLMLAGVTMFWAGTRAGAPFPAPLSPPPALCLRIRSGYLFLDQREQFRYNRNASVATFRKLFAFGPECRSHCLRNQYSPSPES